MRSPMLPGNSAPRMTDSASMVTPAKARSGSTSLGTKSPATLSNLRLRQASANWPAVIEPPETLDIRLMLLSSPVS
jgi:hypothetical protein